MITGPNIVRNGLVFGYDADDRSSRFYPGEPTTNLNSTYSINVWNNTGTATYTSSATDVPKPFMYDGVTLNILRSETATVGNQHIGTAIVGGLTPSTEYTMSVWFRQNRAGSNQPYLRTAVNNNSLGNFVYNGSSNAATWPENTWIRISRTATIQANETGLFVSNYIGNSVGDTVWYYGPQLEQKPHMTQYVYGSRNATSSLFDLHKTTTIDLSNVSFDSTAHPTFDGLNDYINTGFGADLNMTTNPISVNAWVKTANVSSNSMFMSSGQSRGNGDAANARFYLGTLSNKWDFGIYTSGWGSGSVSTTSDWTNVSCVFTGTAAILYINGVYVDQKSYSSYVLNDNIWIGLHDSNYPWYGDIRVVHIYDKPLTLQEVQQNFNADVKRFSII